MRKPFVTIYILLLLLPLLSPCIFAQDDTQGPEIILLEPTTTVLSSTRTNMTIQLEDESGINTNSISVLIDNRFDAFQLEEASIRGNQILYRPSEIFQWKNGNHSLQITVSDVNGNKATKTFDFVVDTTLAQKQSGISIDVVLIVQYIIIGTIIIFIGLSIYILYLKKTRNFTFEKFFAKHPVQKEVFVLYIPIILAFLFTILSIAYVQTTPGLSIFAMEYVLILGFIIAIAPYAIDAQIQRSTTKKYEQAYAQLLFEIADAMRGGLDPTKAIIELSTTDTSVLSENLRSAADNIKLGRPFDHVMGSMAKPIKSDLVKRYATLIGDTSKIGGEPSMVVHRAAKDMDDFIKVDAERRRQLMGQAVVIYIAFGVILIVLYQLIDMFPTLGGINMNLLGSTDLSTAGQGLSTSRMSITTMKQRFFDLLLVNSIGTGTIIGSFIDGHIKFGLIHSIILSVVSVIFFVVMII